MRGVRDIVPIVCLATLGFAQAPVVTDPTPQVLAAAREALGGEKRLSAVRTFTATGRTRQVRGENLVPIEFEIVCELPDKYVRKDEIPAQESGPTSTGFNADELILDPLPPPPPASAPAGAPFDSAQGKPFDSAQGRQETMRRNRVVSTKQDFVRLTLGMFAASFTTYPLTFTHAGLAEAPQGKADVLDVKGPGNFALRFFVHTQTHLPIMVSWQAPAGPAMPARGGPAASPPAAPVEHRLYYSDYRDVDGMQFPFRLRRAVAGQTVEETTFDRFRINAKIDPRRFEVRK